MARHDGRHRPNDTDPKKAAPGLFATTSAPAWQQRYAPTAPTHPKPTLRKWATSFAASNNLTTGTVAKLPELFDCQNDKQSFLLFRPVPFSTSKATRFQETSCSLTRVYLGVQAFSVNRRPAMRREKFLQINGTGPSPPQTLSSTPSPNASLRVPRLRKTLTAADKVTLGRTGSRLRASPWARAQSASAIIPIQTDSVSALSQIALNGYDNGPRLLRFRRFHWQHPQSRIE